MVFFLRALIIWFLLSGGIASAQIGSGPTPALIPANAINVLNYGCTSNASANWSATNAANATNCQAAITAAQSAGVPVYFPAPKTAGACYNYTAPLTISNNLRVMGDFVTGNWNSGINVPIGSPTVVGSVLCPTSNGSNGLASTATSMNISVDNIGVSFQTPFVGTGDCFNYTPTSTNQGLTGAIWKNVICYGHDGDHYGFNFQNFIYGNFNFLQSYGGGGFNLVGNSSSLNFGNSIFISPYSQVIVGGAAHGFSVTANAAQRLNLLLFNRPQAITQSISGVSPGGNPPTSAQLLWNQDGNVRNIRVIAADMETAVSSPVLVNLPGTGSDFDWAGTLSTAADIKAPSWTTNGLLFGPVTRTLTDTTSTGTVAIEAVHAFPSTVQKATSATTYTHLPTLYLGVPVASTNVTATRLESLYTAGAIFTPSNITSSGLFVTGGTQLNHNGGSNTTQLGTGTTSGLASIGGNSNLVQIGGATLTTNATTGFPMLPGMAGTPTGTVAVTSGMAAVVVDTTNKKLCYSLGSGTWTCSAAFTP